MNNSRSFLEYFDIMQCQCQQCNKRRHIGCQITECRSINLTLSILISKVSSQSINLRKKILFYRRRNIFYSDACFLFHALEIWFTWEIEQNFFFFFKLTCSRFESQKKSTIRCKIMDNSGEARQILFFLDLKTLLMMLFLHKCHDCSVLITYS